ncbi:MAG: hypothetical protein EPO28_10915 [Saprospiraceae bacterium]|nr:MAG: hypothetical protein EPO28_10915 [Saprospiraceae bacterium]
MPEGHFHHIEIVTGKKGTGIAQAHRTPRHSAQRIPDDWQFAEAWHPARAENWRYGLHHLELEKLETHVKHPNLRWWKEHPGES